MENTENQKTNQTNVVLEDRDSEPITGAVETEQGVQTEPLANHAETGLNRNLSMAQRRKLLKQQALEEGKPIPKFGSGKSQRKKARRRAGTAIEPLASDSQRDELPKRAASSSLELDPGKQGSKLLKKPRVEGSYAAIASNLSRVVLTCGDYLGREMPGDICEKIKKVIVGQVIAIEEGAFVPRFVESFPRKGSMIFVCEDKESGAWLEGIVGNLDLGQPEMKIRVVKPEELRITKVMAWLPTGVENATDFLKLVRRQNGGVDTTKWAVLNQTPERCLILGLDEPSVEILKNRNLKLTVGVGQTTFKLLNRKTTEAETKDQEMTP